MVDVAAVRLAGETGIRRIRRGVTPASFGYDRFPQASQGGTHELPLGITTNVDWRYGPVDKAGPPFPQTTFTPGTTYTHYNGWGQCAPGSGLHTIRDVRLHVEAPKALQLSSPTAPSWTVLRSTEAQAGTPSGGYYVGNGPYAKVSDLVWRKESTGWSTSLTPTLNSDGSVKTSQCIVHWFFPTAFFPRLPLPAGGVVANLCRMRLISDSGADVSQARFAGCFSGDLFTSATQAADPDGVNPGFAVTRHKRLGRGWRWCGYISGTQAQINDYPPLPALT